MKVLVTGGTGFLGKALARRLKSMDYDVTITGRNKEVGEKLKEEGFKVEYIDLEKEYETVELAKRFHYIFHCAALSSPWGRYNTFYHSNVLSIKHLIKGARQRKSFKRFIHVSTPSIYFDYTKKLNVSEDDKLPDKFVNHYASTKYLAEVEMDKAFKSGFPIIAIRPRALFGPEDTTIIPRLIKANDKKFVPIVGDGNVITDITYIENVVDSLLLAMDSPKETLGQKYNITNDESVYLLDVLEKVFDKLDKPFNTRYISKKKAFALTSTLEFLSKTILLGKEPVLTKYTAGVLGTSMTLDISKAKKELGYKPNVSIDEGIDNFVEWWKKENG